MSEEEISCSFPLSHWHKEDSNESVEKMIKNILIEMKKQQVSDDLLNTSLRNIPSPSSLKDLDEAMELFIKCFENNSFALVFGDYDVDGVTSATLLKRFFDYIGFSNYEVFLPSRFEHGYGLTDQALSFLLEKKPEYLFVVDSGTSSMKQIKVLREHNVKTVVVDHHEAPENFEAVCPVVNPRREDCEFPFKNLCGVGVLFFVLIGLRAKLREKKFWSKKLLEPNLADNLDLVALGTIADQMPLIGVNRILVINGIKKLNHYSRIKIEKYPYIKNFLHAYKKHKFNSDLIAFQLSPLLNSAGRISDAHLAFNMLSSPTSDKASHALKELMQLNSRRKKIQNEMFEKAAAIAASQSEHKGLCIADASFHEGVIGIIANKLLEEYGKPSIVFSKINDGYWKGSCRSSNSVNVLEILQACGKLLEEYGGHESAAGLKIHGKNMDDFKKLFQETCLTNVTKESKGLVTADIEVESWMITRELMEILDSFEPYGKGNPRPVFLVRNVKTSLPVSFGKDNHIKWMLPRNITAIHWNMKKSVFPDVSRWNFCFHLNDNEFFGKKNIQLVIQKAVPVLEGEN